LSARHAIHAKEAALRGRADLTLQRPWRIKAVRHDALFIFEGETP
jgi:hypothetical protein